METNLVRISIAASMLGVSPDTLRKWDRAGIVKSVRTPGGSRRYDVAALEYLQKHGFPQKPRETGKPYNFNKEAPSDV